MRALMNVIHRLVDTLARRKVRRDENPGAR
jgi:hypothetical protein